MPMYEFRCKNKACAMKKFEEFQLMHDTPHSANCPECGQKADRVFSFLGHTVTFREGWHDGLGEYVTTKAQEDRQLEKYGLRRKA